MSLLEPAHYLQPLDDRCRAKPSHWGYVGSPWQADALWEGDIREHRPFKSTQVTQLLRALNEPVFAIVTLLTPRVVVLCLTRNRYWQMRSVDGVHTCEFAGPLVLPALVRRTAHEKGRDRICDLAPVSSAIAGR